MLLENSIFTSSLEKDKILKDEEILSNIFWINVLGFLALKSYGHHSRLDTYFRTEKVQINSITDASADLMLIVKMAVDNKNIILSVGNEITKLFALIKQDKIQQVDEVKFRDLVGKIVLSKLTPDTIVKSVVSKFENGTYSLKDCIQPLYQFAKRKKICNEFVDIAKLMVNNLDDIDNDSVTAAPVSVTTQLVQTMKKRGRPVGSKNKDKSGITLSKPVPTVIASSISTHDQLLKSKVSFNTNNVLDQILLTRKVWKMSEKDIIKVFKNEVSQTFKPKQFFDQIPARISNIISGNLQNSISIMKNNGEDVSILDKLEPIDKTYFTDAIVNSFYTFLSKYSKEQFINEYIKFNGTNAYDINLYKMYYWYYSKKHEYKNFSEAIRTLLTKEMVLNSSKFLRWGFIEEGKELEDSKKNYHSGIFETVFEEMIREYLSNYPENLELSLAKSLFDAYTTYRKYTVDELSKKTTLLSELVRLRQSLLRNNDFVAWLESVGLVGKGIFVSNIINADEKLSKTTLQKIYYLLVGKTYNLSTNNIDDLEKLLGSRTWKDVLSEKNQEIDFVEAILELSNLFSNVFNELKLDEILRLQDVINLNDEKIINLIFAERVKNINVSLFDTLEKYPLLISKIKELYKDKNINLDNGQKFKLSILIYGLDETFKKYLENKIFISSDHNIFSQLVNYVSKDDIYTYFSKYENLVTEIFVKVMSRNSWPAYNLQNLINWFFENKISLPKFSKESFNVIIKELEKDNKNNFEFANIWNRLVNLKADDYFISEIAKFSTFDYKLMTFKNTEITSKTPEVDLLVKQVDNLDDEYVISYSHTLFSMIRGYKIDTTSKIMDYINLPGNEELIPYKDKLLSKLLNHKDFNVKNFNFYDVNDNSDDYSIENKLLLMEKISEYFGGKQSYSKGQSRKLNKEASEMIQNYQDIFFDLFENKKTRKKLNGILDGFGDRKGKVFKQLKDAVFVEPIINEIMGSDTPIKPLIKLDHKGIKNILKFNNFDISDVKLRRKKGEKDTEYLERALKEKDLIDVEDLKLKVVPVTKTPDQLIKKSAELYQYYTKNWAHGDVGLQILEEFDVNIEPEEFKKFKPVYPETVIIPVFHGTGSIAASMILRFGFKILSEHEHRAQASKTGTGFAGRMLGDGLYVGGFIDKTCGYIRDGNNWSNRWGQVGYLLEIEAVMGKEFDHHKKAGDGGDGIKSIEYCLFNPRAQAKIIRAYKVQIIKRKTVEAWYNELYPSGVNESNTEFPSFYKYYLKEDKMKSFKEFLVEQKMPEKNIVTFTFHDDYIPISMTEQLEVNAFIKRFAKKGNPIKVYESQVGNRVEIMTNSEEWLNVTVPDSDEFMIKNPEGLFHQWLFFLKKAS